MSRDWTQAGVVIELWAINTFEGHQTFFIENLLTTYHSC